jgi:8-oxo-dGTP pyrophosphatase MutT (NUDIX family)
VEARLRALADQGRLGGWRGEPYAVVTRFAGPEALRVERAAAPWLGVRAFGVHVNAWVRGPRGPRLWVALRSRTKATHPGKLDHLVAGGQPAGLGLRENLAKEAMEEAGVPPGLAQRAVAVAPFRYRLLTPEGLRDDTLFVYDLELPAEFEPRALDGEVEQFRLVAADEVLGRLRASDDFKYNVGPCILGFLLRQGVLGPQDPERAALLAELGQRVLEPSVPEPQDDVP